MMNKETNMYNETMNHNNRSEETILDMKLPHMDMRKQLAISGASKRYNAKEFQRSGSMKLRDFMKHKYPLASSEHPILRENYDPNHGDSIRLPPRLPRNSNEEAMRDPRLTLSFSSLKEEEKKKELEEYAKEVRWYYRHVSKATIFQGELYPLEDSSYRIFVVLQDDPFYRFDRLTPTNQKLLFGCCVEWFMRQQQHHVEHPFLDAF